jgi:hypothetical protein
MLRSGPAQPWTARLCAICAGVILPFAVGQAFLKHWRWALFDLALAVVAVYHAWRWWPRGGAR